MVSYPYQEQLNDFYCVPACLAMMVQYITGDDVSQVDMAVLLGTDSRAGTRMEDLIRVGKHLGYNIRTGQGASLSLLDGLLDDGWAVGISYSVDVPHFSLYRGQDNGQVILCDPFFGEKVCFPSKKFVRSSWMIDHKRYRRAGFDSGPEIDSRAWFFAIKK